MRDLFPLFIHHLLVSSILCFAVFSISLIPVCLSFQPTKYACFRLCWPLTAIWTAVSLFPRLSTEPRVILYSVWVLSTFPLVNILILITQTCYKGDELTFFSLPLQLTSLTCILSLLNRPVRDHRWPLGDPSFQLADFCAIFDPWPSLLTVDSSAVASFSIVVFMIALF